MSCLSFLGPEQRAALAASSAAGAPLSAFASPRIDDGKRRRMRELAGSPTSGIRESAALAYATPEDVLATLAGDPDAGVRGCVARNPHTPVGALEILAGDAEPTVRGWVAANRATPAAVGRALLDDPDPEVRAVAAWAQRWDHPATEDGR